MTALHLVALITAKPGQEDALGGALRALVEPTRAEAGCLFYDLHRDAERPARYVFTEAWETEAHWRAHDDAPHIRAFRDRGEELIADITLIPMTKLA